MAAAGVRRRRRQPLLPLLLLLLLLACCCAALLVCARAALVIEGCMDPMACNHKITANTDDNSCEYTSCATKYKIEPTADVTISKKDTKDTRELKTSNTQQSWLTWDSLPDCGVDDGFKRYVQRARLRLYVKYFQSERIGVTRLFHSKEGFDPLSINFWNKPVFDHVIGKLQPTEPPQYISIRVKKSLNVAYATHRCVWTAGLVAKKGTPTSGRITYAAKNAKKELRPQLRFTVLRVFNLQN